MPRNEPSPPLSPAAESPAGECTAMTAVPWELLLDGLQQQPRPVDDSQTPADEVTANVPRPVPTPTSAGLGSEFVTAVVANATPVVTPSARGESSDEVTTTGFGPLPPGLSSRSGSQRNSSGNDSGGRTERPLGEVSTANRYEIREELARGGVGRVCRALDPRILREVAFKELQARSLDSEGGLERFIREAQVTGQLEHPGIVPVYDFGWETDGNPYYCMRLLKGRTLREEIEVCLTLPSESADQRLAFRKLLKHFIDVCHAVGYAHDRGVIHRDLKPANVMIGDFGETLVLDWGMAKVLDQSATHTLPEPPPPRDIPAVEETPASPSASGSVMEEATMNVVVKGMVDSMSATSRRSTGGVRNSRAGSLNIDPSAAGTDTQMGSIMGTLPYMPPEQVLGQTNEIDARTDIYALGAILYEVLTGHPPIARGTLKDRIHAIVHGEIKPPRLLEPTAPRAMEAICLKALSKAKSDRYASALELAHEVEAFIADERVGAYSEPWHVSLRRFIRRHKALVLCTASVVSAVGIGAGAWNLYETRRVDGVRLAVTRQFDRAALAIEKQEYRASADALREAQGILLAEPGLEKSSLAQRMNDLGRLRNSGLVQQVEKQLAASETAERAGDLAKAERLLTETAVLLRSERLPDQQRLLEAQRTHVSELVAVQERAAAERERAKLFRTAVDQARFHSGVLRGDRWDQDLAEARRFAIEAIDTYRFFQQIPDRPASLEPREWNAMLDDALEMFLVVADADIRALHNSGKEESAAVGRRTLEWLARSRKLGRTSRILELRSAQCASLMGDETARLRFTASAEKLTPDSPFDFFLLAEAARKDGKISEAKSLYQQALQRDPAHFWSLQFLGVCHLRLHEPAAAVANFTACLAQRPNFAWTLAVRGIAHSELREFDKALDDFRDAEEADPELMAVCLNRGAVHVVRGDFDSARGDFERATQLKPDVADPLINLAETLRKQAESRRAAGDSAGADALFDQAVGYLKRAAVLAPTHAAIFWIEGEVLIARGRNAEAVQVLQQAASLKQSEALESECRQLLAAALDRLGRADEALASLRRAAELTPQDPEVHWHLAQLLRRQGKSKEAMAEYSRALADAGELTPSQLISGETPVSIAGVYKARSLAAAWVGEYRQAMHDYTRSLELEPTTPLLTRRGWAYLTQSSKLAYSDFDEALKLTPGDPDSLGGRGYARVILGDVTGAVLDAEAALKQLEPRVELEGPEIWPLIYNLATIYSQAAGRTLAPEGAGTHPYADRAIDVLKLSQRAAGVKYAKAFSQTVAADTALDSIRKHAGFGELNGMK